MQAFDLRYFEICPTCGKRARPRETVFACDTHGEVTPNYSYLINVFMDDGTENIRTVFFRNQVQRLTGKKEDELLAMRENQEEKEKIKNDLLGQIIKVTGRANKNQMFDQMLVL